MLVCILMNCVCIFPIMLLPSKPAGELVAQNTFMFTNPQMPPYAVLEKSGGSRNGNMFGT